MVCQQTEKAFSVLKLIAVALASIHAIWTPPTTMSTYYYDPFYLHENQYAQIISTCDCQLVRQHTILHWYVHTNGKGCQVANIAKECMDFLIVINHHYDFSNKKNLPFFNFLLLSTQI